MLFIGVWPFLTNVSEYMYGDQYWLTRIFKTFYNISLSSIGLMNSMAYGWNNMKKLDESSMDEPVLDKTQILSFLNVDIS